MDAGGWLMTLRRLSVGLAVMLALSVWAWARPGGDQAHARTADPVSVSDADDGGGDFDDAAHRYKNGQSRHWRQGMIGHGHRHERSGDLPQRHKGHEGEEARRETEYIQLCLLSVFLLCALRAFVVHSLCRRVRLMAVIHIEPVPPRCSPGVVLAFVCTGAKLDRK